jgi:modulator of FtsH protease HflC
VNKRLLSVLVSFLVLFILANASLFRIYEGRQAIITEFGKPVRTVKDAGMHVKIPFIQEIRMLDLRILNWDGYPNQIPTKDKKYIMIDTTARWQIIDPLLFIQTLKNENVAKKRLDGILDGITRDVISNFNLVEAVRNSNSILDQINKDKKIENKKSEAEKNANRILDLDSKITGEVEPITIGREKLSQMIIEKGKGELKELGIDLIDVQIKRITYEASVQRKVFERMISERKRIAEKIRSIGNGEKAKIEGKIAYDLKKIESEAYKTVQLLKGKADAISTRTYAQAYNQSPSFYEFRKKLDVYESVLDKNVKFILSTDANFWSTLKSGK